MRVKTLVAEWGDIHIYYSDVSQFAVLHALSPPISSRRNLQGGQRCESAAFYQSYYKQPAPRRGAGDGRRAYNARR